MNGKQAGDILWPLAAHIVEGKLDSTPAVLRKYPLVEHPPVLCVMFDVVLYKEQQLW